MVAYVLPFRQRAHALAFLRDAKLIHVFSAVDAFLGAVVWGRLMDLCVGGLDGARERGVQAPRPGGGR